MFELLDEAEGLVETFRFEDEDDLIELGLT